MKVILAQEYGFCHGVKRALKKLDEAIQKNPGKKVYSIGEIIHNKDVIKHYQDEGVDIIDNIFNVGEGIGVVRAHGLPDSMIQEANEKGLNIIDATCSYVRMISRIIQNEIKNHNKIYIVGEPGHPEVIAATQDFIEHVTVIDHKNFDPATYDFRCDNIVILSQTTMSEDRFVSIVDAFIHHCNKVTVYNTICQSTRNHQKDALEVAKKVDFMVVLGGKNSSNTKRLKEICSVVVPSFHLENIRELDLEAVKNYKVAGVTAGASTPDSIVQEAVDFLRNL